MRELSLFSGAGGGLLGTKHLLGWECVGYVEIEKYPQEVLKARIRDGYLDPAPIFGDIRKFISEGYAAAYQGMVDVVTGGFPCQDISAAGKGAGITGERSGLWKSMAEVVRQVRPRYVFVENSPMLTIRGLGTVLGDLAAMGFDAEWGVLSAENAGAVHLRARCWVMANSQGERCRKERKFQHTKPPKWITGSSQTDSDSASELPRYGNLDDVQVLGDVEESRESISAIRCGDWWAIEPTVGRVADGVAHRVDRLKAIGNGQVSSVVRLAWEVLNNPEGNRSRP